MLMRDALIGSLGLSLACSVSLAGSGPDALNGEMTGFVNYATGETNAFSTGINLCNVGNEVLDVVDNSTRHPISTQNLYRVDGDGITQLGYSWVSHRFCALQQSLCGTCMPPGGGGCASVLGVGCSDVKSASFVGLQQMLSTRSDVNPVTVDFDPFYPPTTGDALFKRLQYDAAEAIEANNPGARYFVETITLAKDDAAAGNAENNASYREVLMDPVDGSVAGLTGPTTRGLPSVYAWQEIDPSVMVTPFDIPGDGRVYVASNASDNGDGTWTYRYAVMNLNSAQAVGEFTVWTPETESSEETGFVFRDVHYHSGDPYSGTDWEAVSTSRRTTWRIAPGDAGSNANAIRWGTSYAFELISPNAPGEGTVTIETFVDGTEHDVSAVTPGGADQLCPGDCNRDRVVNFDDLVCLLFNFGPVEGDDRQPEDCTGAGVVSFNTITCTLFEFGPCD